MGLMNVQFMEYFIQSAKSLLDLVLFFTMFQWSCADFTKTSLIFVRHLLRWRK